MNHKNIKENLKEYKNDEVERYIAYLNNLEIATKKDGGLKNPWMQYRKDPYLIQIFKQVVSDGLVFDGVDISLQSTGVSYSYQAFKNKMLIAYPESVIDVSIVYKEDTFSFSKESGQIIYAHKIGSPFGHQDKDIVGAYCVIKNKRGQFLTTLSLQEIGKHRKVAKTDYIWAGWFPEMCMKTIIKKACKTHFKDIYQNIEVIDNENYDLTGESKHISSDQAAIIKKMVKSTGSDEKKLLEWVKAESIETIKAIDYQKLLLNLRKKQK